MSFKSFLNLLENLLRPAVLAFCEQGTLAFLQTDVELCTKKTITFIYTKEKTAKQIVIPFDLPQQTPFHN